MFDRPDYESPTLNRSHDYGLLQRLYNEPVIKKNHKPKWFFFKKALN